VNDASFEGPLVPHAFTALTRVKKLPGGPAVASVVVAPTFRLSRLASPLAVPASSTYAVAPAEAFQDSDTSRLATCTACPVGDGGADVQAPGGASTNVTSFETPLRPAAVTARTRTK
jgi:hypothetical protein